MALATLITLTDIQLAYGHHPLLDHADFSIQAGERIGLIGRNGAGKSSLLRLLDGRTLPDDGDIARSSGLRVTTVEQEPELDENATVFDVVCNTEGEHEDWQRPSRVRAVLEKLGLPADAQIAGLSGGTRKRVALARALVDEPDLLLLDEPTNHLDFDGIAWLEDMLRNWKGAAVIITHDRRFLDAVATRIVELDRGRLLSFPGNFSQWQERKAQWLESERLEQARFDKLLAQEEVWIRKGVEARRTRNEGRVRRLERLRVERAERRERVGNVSLALAEGQRSGKLVAELEHVGKRFGDKTVVDDYSTTILRGDRIGIIGPNGAGKTTLLKLILGEMTPDSGNTRMGTNVEVAYFDQMRAQLDENATLVDIISPQRVGGDRRHAQARHELSGRLPVLAGARRVAGAQPVGRRTRAPAAGAAVRTPGQRAGAGRAHQRPGYRNAGTIGRAVAGILGHRAAGQPRPRLPEQRRHADHCFEGDGRWRDYVGGYDEWLVQRPAPAAPAADTDKASKPALDEAAARAKAAKPKPARAAKMNSWELRELEGLPDAIAALEAQQAELAGKLADGSLYRDAPAEVERINGELAKLESELEEKFARWELLEARRESAL